MRGLFKKVVGLTAFTIAMISTATAATSQMSCASGVDGVRTYCKLPLDTNKVSFIRQLSTAPCTFGESWGLADDQVWTAKGCSAEFSAESVNPATIREFDPPKPFGYVNGVFRREA